MSKDNPPCGQCGKPAIAKVSNVPLCVDCYTKLEDIRLRQEAARFDQARLSMAMVNQSLADFEAITGFAQPRIQIPQASTNRGPINFHNIKVDNSIIGSLNSGNVQAIDVDLTNLHNGGNDKAKNALQVLTESVLNDSTLSATQKNDMLDQIALLSSQAAAPAQSRKPGIIKAAFTALGAGAQTVSGVAAAWQAAEPILKSIFGFL